MTSTSRRLVTCVELVAASLTVCVLALAVAEPAPPHGYVEPCTLGFVEDGSLHCEECAGSPDNPQRCKETLGPRGYVYKCRTGGHSAPSEVWCKPKKAAKPDPPPTSYVPVLAASAAAAAAAGALLFLKRRRRTPK